MKIIVSKQGKKILVEFRRGKAVDKYRIDKADDFLAAIDRFFRKRKIRTMGQMGPIRLIGPIGVLTERIIRSIMFGLRFDFDNEQ